MKKKLLILLITIIVLSAMALTAWILYIKGAFLPSWIDWKEKSLEYGNDMSVSLSDRQILIIRSGQTDNETQKGVPVSSVEEIWHSPDNILVQDCLIADITGDGNMEVAVLCFRRARFGKHQPFFIKKNEKTWSQHIAVYRYDEAENTFKSIWMASDIGLSAAEWKYDSIHKRLLIQDKDGDVTAWIWPGFGFVATDKEVSFAVAGDNLIHDNIYNYGLEKNNGDFSFLYRNISKGLMESDIRVLNLETILVDDPKLYGGYPLFGTPVEVGTAAAEAGFQVFTCATNHAFDKGMAGINTTAAFCKEKDITYLGIEADSDTDTDTKPYKIFWKKGYSFAMFNYTMGVGNQSDSDYEGLAETAVHILSEDKKEEIKNAIAEAAAQADAVIVFVHWGTEDSGGIDDYQREWAAVFSEAGADVVVGTHPHVLQPVEKIKCVGGDETLVYYSLGNLVSSQTGEDNRLGGIAEFSFEVTLDGIRIKKYGLNPVVTHHGKEGITCYYLEDYTEELYKESPKNISPVDLWEKFSRIRID